MGLFDAPTLLAYLAAAAVLVLIPGPGTAWIVAQAAAGGTARGVRAAFGLETATLIHALAAGLGLSAVLATSALAFELLKYAGAAYLVWLGIKAWRDGNVADATPAGAGQAAPGQAVPGQAGPRAALPTTEAPTVIPDTAGNVYWRSVLTGVLNPKVAVFFLAFLPQFVHPERGLVWLQFFMLGVLLSLIGLSHSLVLSFAIGRYGARFRQGANRWKQRAIGTVFIAIGLRLALQQRA